MNQNSIEDFNEEQQEVLRSIRVSRIILPMMIGVGVVFYLLFKQFDPAEFAKINWTSHTLFWVVMSLLLLVVRHIAYACLLYTSPSPRDRTRSRMPSSA